MHSEEIEDVGLVVSFQGNIASVEMQRGGGCKSCAMSGMCFAKNTPTIFEIETTLLLEPGDRVLLEITPKSRILSSLLIFILPIVFLGIGYAIASQFLSELLSAIIGMGCLGIGFGIIHFVDKFIGKDLAVTIGRKL